MQGLDLKKYNLPDSPGIYHFRKGRSILYIGKATSLRDRVRSYFAGDLGETRGPWLVKMLSEANNLTWEPTGSVLEALILESVLIKKYQPKYNAKEKDDKSYNYIVITKEKWPRVLVIRGKDLERGSNADKTQIGAEKSAGSLTSRAVRNRMSHKEKLNIKYQFGPFPAGKDLKIALGLVRKIFPFRDNCLPYEVLPARRTFVAKKVKGPSKTFEGVPESGHPCFNRQLGLCPGVCTGEISARAYGKIISRLKMFFSGQVDRLRIKLEREMKILAKKQEFEKAGDVKKELFALNHIQDVALIGSEKKVDNLASIRLEAYDVAHLSGADTVGAMTVWQNGELQPANYRRFKITGRGANADKTQIHLPKFCQTKLGQVNADKVAIDDLANLAEILKRRLAHTDWTMPDVIVVDGDERIRQVAEKIITLANLSIKVVAVTKNKQHKAEKLLGDSAIIRDYHRDIVAVNAEAHRFAINYHRQKRTRRFVS